MTLDPDSNQAPWVLPVMLTLIAILAALFPLLILRLTSWFPRVLFRRSCRHYRYFVDPETNRRAGQPVNIWSGLRIRDKRIRLSHEDLAAIAWLDQLSQARRGMFLNSAGLPPRLVSFLPELRWIVRRQLSRPVLWCLQSGHQDLRALGAFLAGRMEWRRVARCLLSLKYDPHPAVRREVARTLRRKQALADLNGLAGDPDSRVRSIAASVRPGVAYHDRLERYAKHAAHEQRVIAAQRAGMLLFLRQPVGQPTPPKSRSVIQRLLRHIQQLVRSVA